MNCVYMNYILSIYLFIFLQIQLLLSIKFEGHK